MRRAVPAGLLALSVLSQGACGLSRPAGLLPGGLSDSDFWGLTTELSEAPGAFSHSENLVSNEIRFVHIARALTPRPGVYLGVGPEQNFSYIARLRPSLAFIVDIREENRNLHLLYKALFELSADRREFVSRLFSRPLAPAGSAVTARELFDAVERAPAAESLFDETVTRVRHRLATIHGFRLREDQHAGMARVLLAFRALGPAVNYGRVGPSDEPGPSYRALMTAVDIKGQSRSFLADEGSFASVKRLHEANLIVPVIGDFAGTHALRRIAEYVSGRQASVVAFYASNVEVYLNRQQHAAFCRNLESLPHESSAWFIGSKDMRRFRDKLQACRGDGR